MYTCDSHALTLRRDIYEVAKTTANFLCVAQMITNWIVFTMSSVDIFKMIIETTNWLYARSPRFYLRCFPISIAVDPFLPLRYT